uniref:Uncharacterized protein n=1 Tax=Sinocyclocheilus anshuiensis TaxID=1608454 RepID=A0A671MQR2_9TELE
KCPSPQSVDIELMGESSDILFGTDLSVIVFCRFRYCGVTDEGCAAIASALRSNPSHLRELCVSKNKLGNSGV